jgi:hypothetical protein|tara:strand:- start:34 stop:324 length:291 start_codon:yes stop_codon:yes gene_type:complete
MFIMVIFIGKYRRIAMAIRMRGGREFPMDLDTRNLPDKMDKPNRTLAWKLFFNSVAQLNPEDAVQIMAPILKKASGQAGEGVDLEKDKEQTDKEDE